MKYIILGHENPDLDSIVSGYLLQKLLKKQGYDIEFIIPDKNISKKNLYLCAQVGIDPTLFQKDIPQDPTYQYILVDHHERNVPGEIVAIFDHHPTDKAITCPLYHNVPSSSTAMLFVIGNEDNCDQDDIFLAIYAGMVDTAAFHSNKTEKTDVEWAKQQCQKHGFNYEALLASSIYPTDMSNIEEASLSDFKEDNLHGHQVASSCLHLQNPNAQAEQIDEMISRLKDYRQENNYDLFALIVHDITNFQTTVYKIYPDRVDTTSYDEYTSRGKKIIPEISNELKTIQKQKSNY